MLGQRTPTSWSTPAHSPAQVLLLEPSSVGNETHPFPDTFDWQAAQLIAEAAELGLKLDAVTWRPLPPDQWRARRAADNYQTLSHFGRIFPIRSKPRDFRKVIHEMSSLGLVKVRGGERKGRSDGRRMKQERRGEWNERGKARGGK